MLGLIKWMRGVFRSEPEILGYPAGMSLGEIAGIQARKFQLARAERLRTEISRLRRNKKKHSHLQKELDALINRGEKTQTNKGDNQ